MIHPDSIIETKLGGRHILEHDKVEGWLDQFPGDKVIAKEWTPFAWPGGYELHYHTKDGGVLCKDCANANLELTLNEDDPQWFIIARDVLWEGDPIQCDHCNRDIKPEYGDDDGETTSGSLSDKLSNLRVGERVFIEAPIETYQRVQSAATGPRIKKVLGADVAFSTQVWTAVGGVGESVVLVSVTRIK